MPEPDHPLTHGPYPQDRCATHCGKSACTDFGCQNETPLRVCAICISRNDTDGNCITECDHTQAAQLRVMADRDDMEPMTGREIYDGWWEYIRTGKSEGFNRTLRQLRAGILEMVVDEHFGTQIRQKAKPGLDDGLGEHCGCCAHRRGVGVDPCGGPDCPCAPHRQAKP